MTNKYTDLCIIDCDPDDGHTASLDDKFLVFTRDMEILANCVSREIAETLRTALEAHGRECRAGALSELAELDADLIGDGECAQESEG